MTPVEKFIAGIEHNSRRLDAELLIPLMREASGYEPWLSGAMIGFGQYHYHYDSGHQGDCFVTGFAPRKQNMVIYIMPGFEKYSGALASLGKYKTGKSCLYLGALKNINMDALQHIVSDSVKVMQSRYDCIPSP